jgi:N-acetylneuraminic acid mutarotase
VLLETPGVRNLAGSMVAALPDGRVLVAGGEGAFEYGDNENRASAELYDPTTDIWTALPPMPGGHVGGEAVALADGSVLLMGGNDGYDQEGSEIRAPSATRFVP